MPANAMRILSRTHQRKGALLNSTAQPVIQMKFQDSRDLQLFSKRLIAIFKQVEKLVVCFTNRHHFIVLTQSRECAAGYKLKRRNALNKLHRAIRKKAIKALTGIMGKCGRGERHGGIGRSSHLVCPKQMVPARTGFGPYTAGFREGSAKVAIGCIQYARIEQHCAIDTISTRLGICADAGRGRAHK